MRSSASLARGIGWPHGWHGPLDKVYEAANCPTDFYHTPYEFAGLMPGPFPLYNQPVNEVGIYLPSNPGVLPIGLEPPFPTGKLADHAPLIAEHQPRPARRLLSALGLLLAVPSK